MTISIELANRLGFIILGLTNNFAYVIMLSAAYDLLKQTNNNNNQSATSAINASNTTQPYCNEHSTSTILLADTIPSLTTKILYPFLFVNIPTSYKATTTAALTAISFLVTGLFTSQVLIFTGVAFASFSSGLGESTYLSNTPLYGDVSLSGWSMGTGGAGLLGAIAYALLSMILSTKLIMMVMLVVPIAMMYAYFVVIKPVVHTPNAVNRNSNTNDGQGANLSVISTGSDGEDQKKLVGGDLAKARNYGAKPGGISAQNESATSIDGQGIDQVEQFDFKAKFYYLPTLSKYFMPLLLVYFAEYFINQGLFELIYYPEVKFLDHAAQYRWFQVSYQLGVMISRSSLDLMEIKQIWTMSLLQLVNAILFLVHAWKLIHIPSFYLVIAIIIYEGLLGGFTYVNTFYRMKKELPLAKQEFSISTVTVADTLGIVFAGTAALPVHNALCKLYT